jgi:two-component system OmpR family sensor kinase
MASLASCIRSAARATSSAYRTIPARWRLAGGSAALTFLILAVFALAGGTLITREISVQFVNRALQNTAVLQAKVHVQVDQITRKPVCPEGGSSIDLHDFASANDAQIRVFNRAGKVICSQQLALDTSRPQTVTPRFSKPTVANFAYRERGYEVAAARIRWHRASGWVIYAIPLSSLDKTIDWIRLRLAILVLGGSVLALLAGLYVAQRALHPITELTAVARNIERTRDPTLRIPHPEADDEIGELARTLERMLAALDAARNESEVALARQREFVADASHELRTPLTAVLANLELLADELQGEQAESANSALLSTRRMRRLVGDLLLLARADTQRQQTRTTIDLGDVLTHAAAEVGQLAEDHELTISPRRAVVYGVSDDLHRMVLNLVENAIHHTPPGTRISAGTRSEQDAALVVVEDDGPGIPPELQQRVFERFFRGGGDTGSGRRGSGLGLAIVAAVAASHGAKVTLTSLPQLHGSRFEIRFERLDLASADVPAKPASAPYR